MTLAEKWNSEEKQRILPHETGNIYKPAELKSFINAGLTCWC